VYRAATIYIILFAAVGASSPFLQQYYQSLGLPLAEIGLLTAFTSAAALLSAPIWGAINDRVPESRLLVPIATLVGAAGAVGMRLAGVSPLLVLAASAWVVGMTGTGPMLDVRVLAMFGSNRARYGWVRACGSASFIVFAPLVGLLVDGNGLDAIFLIMIPSILLAGVTSVALPPRPASVRSPSLRQAPAIVLHHRPILLFLVGSTVGWAAVASQNAFFSIYLRELGAPASMVGWTWAIAATLEVPVMFLFPWLTRRFGLERLIVLGAAVAVTRQVANVAFTVPALLLACSLIQGVGYALLLLGGVTFVSLQAPKGTAATAQGIFSGVTVSLASILGSGIGGPLAGLLGIRGLYVVSSCLGAVAVVLIALAVLPAARRGSPAATGAAGRSDDARAGPPADVAAEAIDRAV
jgi:MFS transporter, PPP family, 3-phenylpropionic acid transporter